MTGKPVNIRSPTRERTADRPPGRAVSAEEQFSLLFTELRDTANPIEKQTTGKGRQMGEGIPRLPDREHEKSPTTCGSLELHTTRRDFPESEIRQSNSAPEGGQGVADEPKRGDREIDRGSYGET